MEARQSIQSRRQPLERSCLFYCMICSSLLDEKEMAVVGFESKLVGKLVLDFLPGILSDIGRFA